MVKTLAARQGAVCLELNALVHAKLQQLPLEAERCELHLVHCRDHTANTQQLFQMCDRVVANTNSPATAARKDVFHRIPGF